MKPTNVIASLTLLFVLLFCGSHTLSAQNYTFRNYGQQEGICHPFTYTINQDKNGYLWIATGEGLCKFNGLDFENVNTDSISTSLVNVIFKDSQERLWFGFNDGQVAFYDGIQIHALDHEFEITSAIKGITEMNGNIYIASLIQGIIMVDANGNVTKEESVAPGKTISSMVNFKNKLLVGAQEGLFVYTKKSSTDPFRETFAPEELAYINVQTFTIAEDSLGVWCGTEDAGIYRMNFANDIYVLKKIGVEVGLENANVQHIMADIKNELWVSTFNGVYKTSVNQVGYDLTLQSHFTTDNGLKTNYIKQVFMDFEDNIWLATYEEGIAQLQDEALLIYNSEKLNFQDNITAVSSQDSIVWLGGKGRLMRFGVNNINESEVFLTSNGLPNVQITSLNYQTKDDILWIGTEGGGLYQYANNSFRSVFRAPSSMGNFINHITVRGDSVYLATQNGIFHINLQSETHIHYTTREGLPYNDIKQLLPAKDGGLLVATRSNGLYRLKNKTFEIYKQTANVELQIRSLTHDNLGNIWAATDGNGLIGFLGDSLVNITGETGLKNDYCYGLITDHNGMLWVGHRFGLSRVNPENFLIKVFDQEDNMNGAVNLNAMNVMSSGHVNFGTTDGLIVYNPKNEIKNDTPPFANIERVTVSDEVYDHHNPIYLPYNAYKLRIDFLGINLREPEEVTYQYKLEGYDLEWSDITELEYVVYPRVEDGEYTFLLKTYNSEGISNTTPATFKLIIEKPIWKKWWFISLMAVILIAIVLTIIKIRERRQKQLQEFLQKSLDERTREVVEQKEEIELKNRDITDSINYAQRIQESILPSIRKLQDNFTGSFVFYQPRDIVSGDFYWFDRVKNNKFVIVCADSTGHGVPGAFMSMIGTTLIKDICMRPDMDSPAKTLQLLDSELSGTLNQNLDNEKPNDGMDIVVCEIDTETSIVRYASAMRPIIIYKNGEQEYIRGSRSSIGGQYNKDQKVFDEGSIQLSKGDIIYMFSDGYPDQFGGPMGKKFKMVRLKNLLRDIHQKPMEEQYNYVKSTFNLWKEDLDQVDDVLFMGIKI
ncbi:MAG: SpoIIE family protein phosphatase [Bacteroidetes bacterium]|jgi:ligand-binding sensor domain-containing protein/serine phosphatase RsbU (regulator of sigma subunit)|nr:SpoIIE family protein phosphatase [Bacteroidota bacterium]